MKAKIVALLILGLIGDIPLAVSQKNEWSPPSTFRMNENIHNIPTDEYKQQVLIDKYVGMGYGGFALNVSYNNYLTDAGMNAFTSFCYKAKEAGLELWLYDEQGYPSGNAGGRVFEINHAWETKGLFKKDTVVTGGTVEFMTPPGQPIKAICVNDTDTLDVTAQVQAGKLTCNLLTGRWKVVVFSKAPLYKPFQVSLNPGVPKGKVNDHYPSLMIPEATDAFLKITHETYTDYLGDDLGRYFVSTFTDEPSLMAVSFRPMTWSVIPWAEVLSDTLEARYGYRPEDKLMELFEDEGPAGQQVRYQYFHTVGDLISKNYFRKIKEWCNQHNVKSGGHLLLEETMMAHVPLYGDIFACFRQMDAPGIDALSCLPENTPVHTAKLASSAAELSGADRVMSEPCPVVDRRMLNGKEPETEEVRGFVNIQFTGGVTDFNNYLKLSNANNDEKKMFNRYVGRIAQALRGGYSAAEIALFYPIESLWTAFVPKPMHVVGWDSVSGGSDEAIKIEQAFRNTARYLFRNRWDYHCIDTRAIRDAQVINGRLVHGELSWKMVILPRVNTLPSDVWEKLHKFVKSGGFLIIIGDPPINSDTHFPDKYIQHLSAEMLSNAHVTRYPDGDISKGDEQFRQLLEKDVLLEDESQPIRYTHRTIDGNQVYFLINDSGEEQQTKVILKSKADYLLLDPLAGTTTVFEKEEKIKLRPYSGIIFKEK